MKICSKCKVKKPLSEFHKRTARSCGVASCCKICRKEKEKERYQKNREKIIEQKRVYNDENRAKINARQDIYNKKNKKLRAKYFQENKKKQAEYKRNKLKNDPIFNMSDRVRRRINYAFSASGYPKKSKTRELLGCSFKELCAHLEKQFQPGMSWENRGEWEIDHIIPYASAKTKEDVVELSYYKNLQPLFKAENRKKSKY